MAELKDFIPKGNEEENSADSWFVLSSASDEDDEDEDDEPEIKKPNVEQLEKPHESTVEKKENEPTAKKPELQELDNSQEEMLVDQEKENGPIDETKIEKSKDIQMETAEKKEDVPVVKQSEVEQLECLQSESDGKNETDSGDKEPKMEQGEIPQKKVIGEITIEEKKEEKQKEKEIKTSMAEVEKEQKIVEEKKEEKLKEKEFKKSVVEVEKEKKVIEEKKEEKLKEKEFKKSVVEVEKEKKSNNTECKIPTIKESVQRQKEIMMAGAEKAAIVKQKRKPRTLMTDEDGHSEIALEVHALRETLIQLSLNLSSTEEEKYTAIASEVQALRETVTQLNNDLSSRVSQIEARSEQVHTLLCRFIMTRCGNYKDPPTKLVNTTNTSDNKPDTSDVSVQTETSDSVLPEVTVLPDEVSYKNKDKETLPSSVGTMDDTKMTHTENEPKASSFKPDIPSKEQSESHGLKRPRPDDEPSQVSKESSYISETSGESVYVSSPPSKRHEPNQFPRGRRRNRRSRSKHSVTSEHNFRESFSKYPLQTQSYIANKELADLACRYSAENANYWRKNRSNPWQVGNNRKHWLNPMDMPEGDEECSNRFPDELDDFMDKVIDEWAQDEDE